MGRMAEVPILPTTVIGSYPRPKWLRTAIAQYRRGKLSREELEEAFNDAVVAVVREQELAGVDIPSDGEQRRDEMVEYFAERIGGFRFYGLVRVWGNAHFRKPAVVSKLKYTSPIVVKEFLFLKSVTSRPLVKVTITGPYTIAEWSFNEYYRTKEELVFELARIINAELRELEKAGARFVQVDEPALTTHEDEVEWAIDAVNKAVEGVNIKVGMHVCYSNYELLFEHVDRIRVDQLALEFANRGFKDLELVREYGMRQELGLGVIDVHNRRVETPEEVAAAIKRALELVPPDKLYINPDCGLKLLPRRIAFEKLKSMVRGTMIVREELEREGQV